MSTLVAELVPVISFEVLGIPRPQGSHTPIPVLRKGKPKVFFKPAEHFADWRNSVVDKAVKALPDGHEAWDCPVVLRCIFRFPRPKSHYRSDGTRLKPSAPAFPITKSAGDTDKLCRLIGDALSAAGLYKDDSQIVWLSAMKFFAVGTEVPGVQVSVRKM